MIIHFLLGAFRQFSHYQAYVSVFYLHNEVPGLPDTMLKHGMTALGGMTVSSSIRTQSLMIANFPICTFEPIDTYDPI